MSSAGDPIVCSPHLHAPNLMFTLVYVDNIACTIRESGISCEIHGILINEHLLLRVNCCLDAPALPSHLSRRLLHGPVSLVYHKQRVNSIDYAPLERHCF